MNAPAHDHVTSAAGAMRLVCSGADHATVVRAERLQLRAFDRNWADEALAALLRRLATRHSLARANGWGSAGKCPASASAKTPAAGGRDGGSAACCTHVLPARASHGPAPASSEPCSDVGARVLSQGVRHG
ncbi:MAG: hypothetical protein JNM58_00610 [Xanthomonadaceae bacterium]|nr:hypothetical protein [Xanthomonadaceae bacterium]